MDFSEIERLENLRIDAIFRGDWARERELARLIRLAEKCLRAEGMDLARQLWPGAVCHDGENRVP